MTIYLTGCTHFGHENIIRLAKRPFSSVEEMDEKLIENWNTVVGEDDIVFHLGDFAWKDHDLYRDRLSGTIIFLQGNHDPEGWGYMYREVDYQYNYRKRKIVLFHYPIEEWDKWWGGSVHFHCHTHKEQFHSAKRRGNVTVEACEYTPISLDRALQKLGVT